MVFQQLDFWMGGLLEDPRTAFHPFIHQSINPLILFYPCPFVSMG
jgi:hypothetical protein